MQEHDSRDIKYWPRFAAISVIRLYQKTRILREPSCRFYPSCSEYMLRSIEAKGLLRGVAAGIFRLAKCHPFHPGGVDEVMAGPRSIPNTATRDNSSRGNLEEGFKG